MTSFRFASGALIAAGLLVVAAACSSSEDSAPAPSTETDASPDGSSKRDTGANVDDDSGSTTNDAGDGGDGGTVPSVVAADVCKTSAQSICAFLSTCVPEILTEAWASGAECEPRFENNCLAAYPPNAKVRKDDADAYETCLEALTCDALYGPKWTTSCVTPRLASTKANGAACRSDFECTSGACTGSSTTCGTCVTRKKAGDACTDSDECPVGGYCNQKCRAIAYLGDACDDYNICGNGLGCNATTKKCEKIGAVGSPCDSDLDCDIGNLIQCNRGAGKCEKVTFLDPGSSCPAAFDQGPPQVCGKGSSCIRPAGDAGTCVTNAKVGEACSGSTVRCEAFINCRSDVCVLPTYKSCP